MGNAANQRAAFLFDFCMTVTKYVDLSYIEFTGLAKNIHSNLDISWLYEIT